MSRMMFRVLPSLFVLVFLVSPYVWGQTVEEGRVMAVKLKDGRTLRGVIKKRDDGIEIKIQDETQGGIWLKFSESEIESIQPAVSPKDAYLARRAAADLTDAESLYQLAQWVWRSHQEDMVLLRHARSDLRAALKIRKNYTPAVLLLRQVEAKIKILNSAKAGPGAKGESLTVEDRDLVTNQDIYWIRLQELRDTDRVRIKYENKVLQRYVDMMRGRNIDNWDRHGKETHFLAQPRIVQVMEILRNKPNDMQLLKDIHVEADPRFMTDFRSRIWPIIQNNCAKPNCHGGPKANGGLKFFVIPGTNVRADYTNFLIVSGWRKGKHRLLNRQDVEMSLILQYGLNPRVAKRRHPFEIPPVFTGIRSGNYRRVYQWMSSLQKPLAPNYHIHSGFKPAGMTLDTTGLPLMMSRDEEEPDEAGDRTKDE